MIRQRERCFAGKISSENQTGETVNDSDEEKDAQNAAGSITVAIQDDIENTGTLTAQLSGNVSNGITLEWYNMRKGAIPGQGWSAIK